MKRDASGCPPPRAGEFPASRYDVPALRQGIRLVELLCVSDRPLGVSQIGEALGINKSMVFRLLQTLVRSGWVIREGERQTYRMGLRPFHYASQPVERMDLAAAAAGPLRALWEATGESTYLGVLDDDRVLYLEHRNATGPVRIAGRVGGRYLLHCSAPGKVLLAHAGEELFRRLVRRGLERQTPRTICRPDVLRRQLREVVRRGFAVDLEEYAPGCLCYAAPVRDHAGRVVAALGVSVLTLHYTPERMSHRLGPRVREAAEAVSRTLGFEGPPRRPGGLDGKPDS